LRMMARLRMMVTRGGDEPSKMDNRKRKKKKNKDQSSTDKRPTKRARGRGI
jgi:hypothetical protein